MLKYIAGEPEVDLVLIISNKDDIAAVARVIHQDTEPRAGESTRLRGLSLEKKGSETPS